MRRIITAATSTPLPPGGSTLSSILGITSHYTNYPSAFDLVRDAGIKWIRKDISWDEVERTRGVYDFSAYDVFASSIASRGLKPLWLLCYNNTLYTSNWLNGPATAANRTAFGNYAEASAAHFGGDGALFEVWNEPDGATFWLPTPNASQYAALAQSTLPRVRAGNPTARVLTGGIWIGAQDYLRSMLSAGATNGYDGISVHPYWLGGDPMGDPELVFDYLQTWQSIKNQYSIGSLPNWDTEFGYRVSTDTGGNQTTYAAKMARMLLSFWAADFKIIIIYDMDDGEFGLLNAPNSQGYQAVKTLTTVSGTRTIASFNIPSNNTLLNSLRMQGPNNVVDALWLRTGQQTVAVPAGSTAIDMLGNPKTISGNTVSISAAAGPVYVTHS